MFKFFKQKDKQGHIWKSAVAVVGQFMVYILFMDFFFSLLASSAITLALGITKEKVYDGLLSRGTPDVMDVVADVIGIAIGCVIVVLGWSI